MAYASIQDIETTGILPKATINVSVVALTAALNNASAMCDDSLNARYLLPIFPPYPYSLVQATVSIAVWLFMRARGFNPEANGADALVIRTGYTDAMQWLDDVANERKQPRIIDSSPNGNTAEAPAVLSSPPRGWEWLPGYGFGNGGSGRGF